MGITDKLVHRINHFYQYYIVKEQYPMLTSFSRRMLKRNGTIGLVYMLHHICDKDSKRIPTNEELKVSPAFLEKIILKYRSLGFDFISLDQLYNLIFSGIKPQRPFVTFTIDDGYLDNYTKALPVFERYQVPFAIFVSTDFIDKKAILWWDTLEDLILTNDVVMTSDGKCYPCQTYQQRWDTFRYLRERIMDLDQNKLADELTGLFSRYHIDWYAPIKQQGMSWKQVKSLSEHQLCTIGGHTVSHPVLKNLSIEAAKYEIIEGIKRIEEVTQQKVYYFAYPYGTPNEIGNREHQIVSSLDVRLSFMAHQGCLTMNNLREVTHLPRIFLHENSFI